MNLPNRLTLIRIILVPVFMAFALLPGSNVFRCVACGIFALAAITDFFDGKIARGRNLITNFGKFLDPLADKFMVFGSIICFCASSNYWQDSELLHWGFIISGTVVIFRELAVTSIRLVASGSSEHIVIAASWLGKIKTFSQCIYILIVFLEPVIFSGAVVETHTLTWVAMSVMTIMTVWSGVDYLKTYWSCLNPNE